MLQTGLLFSFLALFQSSMQHNLTITTHRSFHRVPITHPYMDTTPKTIHYTTHFENEMPLAQAYVFYKSPSAICTSTVEEMVGRMPPCSIYGKRVVNQVPLEAFRQLYPQLPYVTRLFSSKFIVVDSCVIEKMKGLRAYDASFAWHISLYSQIMPWTVFEDQGYIGRVPSNLSLIHI